MFFFDFNEIFAILYIVQIVLLIKLLENIMIKKIVLNDSAVEKIKPATSRIFVFDVSGSMYDALPKMKKHLKEKLFEQIPETDDISLVYFSGRGEYGVLVEGLNVSKVKDLKSVYEKIDSLRTIGLTGFMEPLKEVGQLVKRLPATNIKEMFFLTDGYDNQWSEKEVLNQCKELVSLVDNAYIVEYGWYCNTPLIKKMVETLNGVHLFSEDIVSYQSIAEKIIAEGTTKKVKIKLPEKTRSNLAFYMYNENITVVVADEENMIAVPEDLKEYGYIAEEDLSENLGVDTMSYMALFAYASRKDAKSVYEILAKLGDVKLIKQYVNTFGKQDLIKFLENVEVAVKEESGRMIEGCDYNLVPSEEAYNVVEMIQDLMVKGNLLYPEHEAFNYKRIGRAKEVVSIEERVAKVKEELANTTDSESLKAQAEKMVGLLNSEDLKFETENSGKGIEISNLTWHESRPNLSVLVRKEGFVKVPKNKFDIDKLETFIYRNYTIIKDGILNMNSLPVSLVKETFDKLQANGLLKGQIYEDGKLYVLDFSVLPIINRKMVKIVSAKELFTKQLQAETIKGKNKVFKDYLKALEPKTSIGWKNQYGEEAVTWLTEMGLTEYNGFNPKVKSAESTDFYIGKELILKVKGWSALPKVADVEKLLNEGKKLGIKDLAMAEAINEYRAFIKETLKGKQENDLVEAEVEVLQLTKIEYLKGKLEELKKLDKKLGLEMSKVKFAIVIGQSWFVEFSSEDESTLEMDYFNTKATVSAEIKDIEVKI